MVKEQLDGEVVEPASGHSDAAGLFAKREVVPAMHRHRQDVVVMFEDLRRAIALMDIEVKDSNAPKAASVCRDCDRNVIEHAEARTLVPEGMMRSSCQRAAPAAFQCLGGGAECAADRG